VLSSPPGRGMNPVKPSARMLHSDASHCAPLASSAEDVLCDDRVSRDEPCDGHKLLGRFSGALVVDDDDPFRRSLSRWLRELHIHVSEAKTVAEGTDLLARAPELIITDVRLPDGNGRKIVEAARRRRPAPLIVAVSGLASAGEAFALAQCGVRVYLMKPFARQELLDGILDVYGDPSGVSDGLDSGQRGPVVINDDMDLRENLRWFARYYSVPQREMALVQLATSGIPRARCPEMLGISENTCKTLTRRLLQRCGARSLAQIPRLVLMGAPRAADA
jgi:DNA-binding NarL/FixJ family response regulator